ncbi:shufflon system plasmid conjugative transfer pilus tip adhesin PilV [Pectobacterium betavasculorum]|uniref:shufflon system plasmid conjugative transfer pilus tip adhesin PilV n=1 Tax=Pectobacterium betavasculorum TaxID=55207 RepID=UPI00313D2F35
MSIAKMPHRGWAMMEMGVALLILLGVAVWGTSVYRDYMQELQYQVMAQHGTRFKAALKEYVGRHYDTLLSQAGTKTPVIVTAAMLKNTGVLAAGFSETNTAGQRWQGAVVRSDQNPSKPQLQAVVYTQSGAALPFKGLRFISMNMDGGGYIWDAGKITGAMGMWTEPLATFGVNTTPGQLAAILTTDELSNARGESDRLYRFAVNGKPDLNRMHTAIDMGGNNINNAGNIYGQSGNFSKNVNIAEDLNVTGFSSFGKRVTMNSDLAVKNGVSSDSYIRAKTGNSSVQVGGGGSSDPNAVLMNVTGGNGSGYLSLGGDGSSNVVKLAIWGSQKIRGDLTLEAANDGNAPGNLTAAGTIAGKYLLPTSTVVSGESCYPYGILGKDKDGSLYSCVKGLWKSMQKADKDYFTTTVGGGGVIASAEDYFCSINGWDKHPNTRSGNFDLSIINGSWVASNGGRSLKVDCFKW